MKQLLVLGLGILMVCLSACSDDDPKEPQNAPRSLITEFVRPGSLFHEESAFNVQFVLNEKVVGSSPTRGSKAKSLKPSQLATWLGFLFC